MNQEISKARSSPARRARVVTRMSSPDHRAVISSIEIIDEADRGIEEVQLSKAGLVHDPAEPRMGLNQTDIISQIMTRGYAIHTTRLDTNIDLSGSKLA